jgi:hypothetical protein
MPGHCSWNDCKAKYVKGKSQSVPSDGSGGKWVRGVYPIKGGEGFASAQQVAALKNKWAKACGRMCFGKKAFICKEHFSASCFEGNTHEGKLLYHPSHLPRPRQIPATPDKYARSDRETTRRNRQRVSLSPGVRPFLVLEQNASDQLYRENVDLQQRLTQLSERVETLQTLSETSYCYSHCRLTHSDDMVACDTCDTWYHRVCLGLPAREWKALIAKSHGPYCCPGCIQ